MGTAAMLVGLLLLLRYHRGVEATPGLFIVQKSRGTS